MRKLFSALTIFAFAGVADAQTPTWTGFYIGAHGAYTWADQDFPNLPSHIPSPVPAGQQSGPPRMELSGGMLGGQIGAQYHFNGGVLIGVEADYSRGNLSETVRDGNAITQTGEIEWTGTLRARLGLPMGAWMPYVTGGLMWMGGTYNQQCPQAGATNSTHCNSFDRYSLTDTRTHTGWVGGAGVEWMVARNFSVKAEALWYKVGDETYDLGKAPITGKNVTPVQIEYDGMLFRIGGNYRF